MDKNPQSTPQVDEDQLIERAQTRLPQPAQTKLSAILNGMGNGAMVGAATYVTPKTLAILRGKPVPEVNPRISMYATAGGTLLGIWYGLHEAKSIEEYRDSIGKEIIHLRDRVKSLEGKKPTGKQSELVTAVRDDAETALAR